MDSEKIKSALADVTAEQDPTLKSAKLASLCSALWLERGVELVVVGMYLDLLGPVESFARTPYRRVEAPYGSILLMKPEDLLVERVLMTFYLGESQTARDCAKKFISVILTGGVAVNWNEVRRLANLPEYRNLPQCVQLVKEVAGELKIKSPLHPD
jgi:hypothetical protein